MATLNELEFGANNASMFLVEGFMLESDWKFLKFIAVFMLFVFAVQMCSTTRKSNNNSSLRTQNTNSQPVPTRLDKAVDPGYFLNLLHQWLDNDNKVVTYRNLNTACSVDQHPTTCNEAVRQRTVQVISPEGFGSGGILQSDYGIAVVATAAHVVATDNRIKVPIRVDSEYLRYRKASLICLNSKSIGSNSFGRDIGFDQAFLFISSDTNVVFEKLEHSRNVGSFIIGEHGGEHPNVLMLYKAEENRKTVLIRPKLWTGSSGSLVYSKRGGVYGVNVGMYKDVGVVSKIERSKLNPLNIIFDLDCYSGEDGSEITLSEKKQWLGKVKEYRDTFFPQTASSQVQN